MRDGESTDQAEPEESATERSEPDARAARSEPPAPPSDAGVDGDDGRANGRRSTGAESEGQSEEVRSEAGADGGPTDTDPDGETFRFRSMADDIASARPDSADRPAHDGAPPERVDLDDPAYYFDRELSELAFQRRVLAEARDETNPLLERVRFLAILTANLDEFFRKRIGGLDRRSRTASGSGSPTGSTPDGRLADALEAAGDLLASQARCYCELLRPALEANGIEILDYEDLSPTEAEAVRSTFEASILPTLTPLTFDPAHPFPFISNQSLSLAVLTRREGTDDVTFSRVKIPRNRARFVTVEPGSRYVLLEDVVRANLDRLFPAVEIVDTALFRVTRNAEVRRADEADDMIEATESVLERRRFGNVVRLEIEPDAADAIVDTLTRELDLADRQVFSLPGPLEYRDFHRIASLDRPDLDAPEWTPQPHPRLAAAARDDARTVFDAIRANDILVHHPYHSFEGTVCRFLERAATDPDVLAIKAAIYRTASESRVIESLITAARNGTQVAVMVELAARFDEANNLEWVERLEAEGIHVAYGTIDYKTHSKTALVVREETDGVGLYSHVGTGNYHSETAKGYEDLGLLTADPAIGRDLVALFNYYTGQSLHGEYETLLVAPVELRDRLGELIRTEAEHARNGEDARLIVKVNRLEDPELIRELYRASMAGVEIDLIVRDICRLRPGIDGVSDRITVHSIVGRFLEHSRIVHARDGGSGRYYVGSADWMQRNLDDRIETLAPVDDPSLRRRLDAILETLLADERNRWVLGTDGTYEPVSTEDENPLDAHEMFMKTARRDAAALPDRPGEDRRSDGDAP
ncbi:polyphosphate kinase 1 [Halovivax limisalsi]|uniref:polyphosphate kinase 1 n=1 Tax=Halovivax limisalsi TaxID=1453760 RepID=UPI001FFCC6E6|nr:polyphosphate kinase 1 [Halovivax limisalsi]